MKTMKKTNRKIVSVILAILMMTTWIPMVSALDLTADTIEIASVEDWNAVAAQTSETFEGKTVKLTANIDFKDVTATFPLFNTFKGTFDGNGKVLKNATISACKAMIATTLNGTVQNVILENNALTADSTNNSGFVTSATDGALVQDITAKGCVLTTPKSNAAILVGSTNDTNADQITTVQNCTIEGCTIQASSGATGCSQSGFAVGAAGGKGLIVEGVTVTGSTLTLPLGATAAIVGKVNNGPTFLTVQGCKVSGTTIESTYAENYISKKNYAAGIGLVVGQFSSTAALTVAGCDASGTVKTKGSGVGLSGLIGAVGPNNVSMTADCNISGNNVNVTAEGNGYFGGVLGYARTSGNTVTVERNTVVVNAKGISDSGGLIGQLNGYGTTSLLVDSCNVSGKIYENSNAGGAGAVGGILGRYDIKDANGKSRITKCRVEADLFCTAQYGRVGGLVGIWGKDEEKGGGVSMPTELNISDCYISGDFSVYKGGAYTNAGAGIIDNYRAVGSKWSISNVIVACSLNQVNNSSATDGDITVGGGKVSAVGWQSACIVMPTVKNVYTTFADNTNFDRYLNLSVSDIPYFITNDKAGFITSVAGKSEIVSADYVQTSTKVNGTYMIRFVAPCLVSAGTDAGMVIKAYETGADFEYSYENAVAFLKDLSSKTPVQSFTTNTCLLVDQLSGKTDAGMESYDCKDYGAAKFMAVAIDKVPVGTGYLFTVTPTLTTGGVTVSGETTYVFYSADGELLNAAG